MGNKEIIERNRKDAMYYINDIQIAILDSDLPGKEDFEELHMVERFIKSKARRGRRWDAENRRWVKDPAFVKEPLI